MPELLARASTPTVESVAAQSPVWKPRRDFPPRRLAVVEPSTPWRWPRGLSPSPLRLLCRRGGRPG
eukprot:2057025-Lingulodinium_polyedra.AAC.1